MGDPRDSVTIELELPPLPLQPGSTVAGAVVVRAPEAGTALALVVRLLCEVVERDEPREKERLVWRTVDLDWPPGGGRYPFTLEMPRRARESYAGKQLRCEWTLEAELNLRPLGHRHVQQAIAVRAASPAPHGWRSLADVPAARVRAETDVTQRFGPAVGCTAVTAAIVYGAYLWGMSDAGDMRALVYAGIASVPALGLLWSVWSDWWQDRRLGAPTIELAPFPSGRGAPVFVRVSWRPDVALTVQKAEIALVATERVDRVVKRDDHTAVATERNVVRRTASPLRVTTSGLFVVAEGSALMPPDATLPFEHAYRQGRHRCVEALTWAMEITVDFEGVVAWTKSIPLDIEQPSTADVVKPAG